MSQDESNKMTLKVFLYEETKQGGPEALAARLDDRVHLRYGKDVPDPADYEILIGAFPPQEFLDASPQLKALIIPFSGPPQQTQDLLRQYPHIAVHNTPYNYIATAETATALLLAAAKFIAKGDRNLRRGDWTLRYSDRPQLTLHGKRILILGYGRIGRHVAPVFHALGMEVIGVRRTLSAADETDAFAKVYAIDQLPDLLPRANALLIALPGTPATEGVIGAEELALLPQDAIIVNVGRGNVIDEDALYHALINGKLAAAGIDVWYNYPKSESARTHTMPSQYPIHELENVILSPHRAGWLGKEDESRMIMLAEMVNEAAAGRPLPNRVNVALGY